MNEISSKSLSIPKRVVIVDDSASVRMLLRKFMERDARLTVVGEAADPFEAREVIKQVNPDVITLDVKMPRMSGIDFLRHLMRLWPMPVVMISSETTEGSDTAIKALSLGAIDYLSKTDIANIDRVGEVCDRVFIAASTKVRRYVRPPRVPVAQEPTNRPTEMPLIVLGASTGGVSALEEVIAGLDPFGPPVVIVQHMPQVFLTSFANRLSRIFDRNVRLGHEGDCLGWGDLVLAPETGAHMTVHRKHRQWVCGFTPAEAGALHCPSVDALFRSLVPFAPDVIAGVLTGLGRDGADAMLMLREAGARTFSQSKESCVVYGMPRAAHKIGASEKEVPLNHMGQTLTQVARHWTESRAR